MAQPTEVLPRPTKKRNRDGSFKFEAISSYITADLPTPASILVYESGKFVDFLLSLAETDPELFSREEVMDFTTTIHQVSSKFLQNFELLTGLLERSKRNFQLPDRGGLFRNSLYRHSPYTRNGSNVLEVMPFLQQLGDKAKNRRDPESAGSIKNFNNDCLLSSRLQGVLSANPLAVKWVLGEFLSYELLQFERLLEKLGIKFLTRCLKLFSVLISW